MPNAFTFEEPLPEQVRDGYVGATISYLERDTRESPEETDKRDFNVEQVMNLNRILGILLMVIGSHLPLLITSTLCCTPGPRSGLPLYKYDVSLQLLLILVLERICHCYRRFIRQL